MLHTGTWNEGAFLSETTYYAINAASKVRTASFVGSLTWLGWLGKQGLLVLKSSNAEGLKFALL